MGERTVPCHARTAEEWDPETFPLYVAAKENYAELHQAVVDATRGHTVRSILDLGGGTGESARRLLATHPDASVVVLDANKRMLEAAMESLPEGRAATFHGRMEDTLPDGPFDLVVSVLAVHHLDKAAKQALFATIAGILTPGGRFVLGDLVKDPNVVRRVRRSVRDYGVRSTVASIVRRRTGGRLGYAEPDIPDLLTDLLRWFGDVGLEATITWTRDLLVVITAARPAG